MFSDTISALYLHGARVGAQFDMALPKRFSVNIGLLYSVMYGVSRQHYHSVSSEQVQTEVVNNHIVEHALTIPVRVQYNIPLYKQLSMHLYAGPQLMLGLAETDYIDAQVSDATRTWLLAQGKRIRRQGVKGLFEHLLKLIPVRFKPRSLVIKRQPPEKI